MTHMTNLDQLNSAIRTINRIKGEVEASMRGILSSYRRDQGVKEAKQSAEPIMSALHAEAIKDDSDFMLVQHALTDLGRAADDQVMDAMQAAFDAARLAY